VVNGAILSAAIALMHANLHPGQTPKDFLKGASTNWSKYPGTQHTWMQLYLSLKKFGLIDTSLLDLPADQTDNHIPRADAEYKAEYEARPEVKAAQAEYNEGCQGSLKGSPEGDAKQGEGSSWGASSGHP
jgi:hypothetical protein